MAMVSWRRFHGEIGAPRSSWARACAPYCAPWALIWAGAWGCGTDGSSGDPDLPLGGAAEQAASETGEATRAGADNTGSGSPQSGAPEPEQGVDRRDSPAEPSESATAEATPALACEGLRKWSPMADPPGPLVSFLMQPRSGAPLGVPRSIAIDGMLYVIAHLGTPPVAAPGGLEAAYAYDSTTDSWRDLSNAGQLPAALGAQPAIIGDLDDGVLVTSGGPGPSTVAIYRPGDDAWELLDDGPLSLATRSWRLFVRDDNGALVDAQDTWSNASGRESHAAVVGERLFVWGGQTPLCDDDGTGGCVPAGVNEDTPIAQPFMERSVHGDGRVLRGSTGEWTQVTEDGAPDPRFGANVGQLGDDHVLVFGGYDQPIWGPGADTSLVDFALSDGALYDVAANLWEPFVRPPGPPLVFDGDGTPGEQVLRGIGRLGNGWVLSTYLIDDTGTSSTQVSYRYHPEDRSWETMPEAPVFGPVRVLETRDGKVLYLGDYQSWLFDWDAMAYRMIDVSTPALPVGVQPVTSASAISAWDGCQLLQWGFMLARAEGCDGPLPPDLGCDPFVVTEFFPEGVRFTLGADADDEAPPPPDTTPR